MRQEPSIALLLSCQSTLHGFSPEGEMFPVNPERGSDGTCGVAARCCDWGTSVPPAQYKGVWRRLSQWCNSSTLAREVSVVRFPVVAAFFPHSFTSLIALEPSLMRQEPSIAGLLIVKSSIYIPVNSLVNWSWQSYIKDKINVMILASEYTRILVNTLMWIVVFMRLRALQKLMYKWHQYISVLIILWLSCMEWDQLEFGKHHT